MDTDFPRLSSEQRSSLEKATQKYAEALPGSPAEEHLAERGIDASVASGFRLGYVAEPEVGHEPACGRLAIPYITPTGVVAIRFRWLPGAQMEDRKYWQPSGSRVHLFNVWALHGATRRVALTEGELDAVVLHGLCGVDAVGIQGATAWKAHFRHAMSGFDEVLIVMDADDAGQAAARKLRKDLPNGKAIALPEGDVNEYYQEYGREAVRKVMGFE